MPNSRVNILHLWKMCLMQLPLFASLSVTSRDQAMLINGQCCILKPCNVIQSYLNVQYTAFKYFLLFPQSDSHNVGVNCSLLLPVVSIKLSSRKFTRISLTLCCGSFIIPSCAYNAYRKIMEGQ